MADQNDTQTLTAKQAAALLQVHPQTLQKMRCRGGGIPYTRIGRGIRYRLWEVEHWMKRRSQTSTAQNET